MKKIVLFFMFCMLLLGCEDRTILLSCEDRKVKNYGEKAVFIKQCDTSAVWRVKIHPLGRLYDSDHGIIAVALADGKRFSVKYHAAEDATKDWMLLNEGDTIVYQGDNIVSIIWKGQ